MNYIKRLKRKDLRAIWKIRSSVINFFRKYLIEKDFVEISAPSICTMTDTAPTFKLNYYGKSAQLATSSQLYKQLSLYSFNRVFFLQPVFRKENLEIFQNNHLTEFWQLDIEMIGSMNSLMKLIEDLFLKTLQHINLKNSTELKVINRVLPSLNIPFPRENLTNVRFANVKFVGRRRIFIYIHFQNMFRLLRGY